MMSNVSLIAFKIFSFSLSSAFDYIFRYGFMLFGLRHGFGNTDQCFSLDFKLSAIISCTFPLLSFPPFSFWYFCYIYFGIPHFSQVLSIFILLIPLTFHILLIYLKFLDPFFCQLKSTLEPFKRIFHFTYCTFQF